MRNTLLILCLPLIAVAQPATAPAKAATAQIAAKANAFLATLPEEQRSKVIFKITDDAQRARWSNLPGPMFQRDGLRVGDLTGPQRDAAMAVVASALSAKGYQKVLEIMEGDEVLKNNGGANTPGGGPGGNQAKGGPGPDGQNKGKGKGKGGGGGGGLNFGRDNYYISFLGNPSATEPWILQFGGHHLAVNVILVGEHGILTPTLTAAQPAIYQLNGKTVRPLGAENDKAFALLATLTPEQQKQAILGYNIRDLVLGATQDGKTIAPEGIKASALNAKQQAMLWDLASEWTGIVHPAAAAARMAEIKADVANTWFAWSGATENGKPAYFRIQGPTLHIEYAPQAMGGDATMHIHTIYRDPTNDYGAKWIKK